STAARSAAFLALSRRAGLAPRSYTVDELARRATLLRAGQSPEPLPAAVTGGSVRVIRLNRLGGSSVFTIEGPCTTRGQTRKAGQDMSAQPQATGMSRWVGISQRTLMAWRILSATMLLVMGAIHLYLVFYGVGGVLGAPFVLNAVGALALAIAIIGLRG